MNYLQEVEESQGRIEGFKADAIRFRYLRGMMEATNWEEFGVLMEKVTLTGDLTAAIDEAMRRKQ